MLPHEFVRVQVRSIAGEKVQLETAALPLYERRDELGDMRRVAVENEHHGTTAPPQKLGEQGHEVSRVQPSGIDVVPERPAGRERRNGVDRLPLSARRHDRRLSLPPP